MRVLRLGEPAQVPDHHQDVLVHRVDVKEVVLHLADDAPERRHQVAEDSVEIHPAQLVRDAARLAQDLDEPRAIARVAAEARVDAVPVAPQRAQRARRHPAEPRMALHREERIEHRRRALLEQRLVADVEKLVDRLERVVDRDRLVARRKEPRVQVLQQDDVDLADELRRAIVALHQLLARGSRRRVGEAELARERILLVEHEAVLAPSGEIVEPRAQSPDQPLLPRDGARLLARDEARPRQLAPRAPEAGGARDPQHGLQVAEPSGALLDVGLEVVRGVVVLEVPLLLLERLRLVEERHVERGGDRAAERAVQRARARDPAVLEKARLDGDVGGHLRLALGDRAHAVPDLETDVPQRAEKALDELGAGSVGLVRQQDQHVYVGVGKELAAAVAADGHQRCLRRRAELVPDAGDDAIDEPRVLAQQPSRIGACVERGAQCCAAGLELCTAALRRVARGVHGRRRGEPVHRARRQGEMGGGEGEPDEVVSTS